MTEDFLKGHPDREAIINGDMKFDKDLATEIYPKLNFLPQNGYGYIPCLCAKSCETVCYKHLKEIGKL